jgi:hypothetical protein
MLGAAKEVLQVRALGTDIGSSPAVSTDVPVGRSYLPSLLRTPLEGRLKTDHTLIPTSELAAQDALFRRWYATGLEFIDAHPEARGVVRPRIWTPLTESEAALVVQHLHPEATILRAYKVADLVVTLATGDHLHYEVKATGENGGFTTLTEKDLDPRCRGILWVDYARRLFDDDAPVTIWLLRQPSTFGLHPDVCWIDRIIAAAPASRKQRYDLHFASRNVEVTRVPAAIGTRLAPQSPRTQRRIRTKPHLVPPRRLAVSSTVELPTATPSV